MALIFSRKTLEREMRLWLLLSLVGMQFLMNYSRSIVIRFRRSSKKSWWSYAAIILTCLSAIPLFIAYEGLKLEQILMFMVLPFTLSADKRGVSKMLLYVVALLGLVTYLFIDVYSIFYLGFCFSLLLFLSHTKFKPTFLSILLVLITAPALRYILSVSSFSFRLWLTDLAGGVLSVILEEVVIMGNTIVVNGTSFSVAPECLGLNMLTSAMVCALFGLGFFYNKINKRPSMVILGLTLTLSLVLIVVTNLIRIILTVVFQVMPETFYHEFLGILLFFFNCCLPLLYLIKELSNHHFFAVDRQSDLEFVTHKPRYFHWLVIPLIISAYFAHSSKLDESNTSSEITIKGFQAETCSDGVQKYSNQDVLLYLKPQSSVIGADHNPYICWRGSGYSIANESLAKVESRDVCFFELYKEGDAPLYSCYWFDNGLKQTISSFNWRMDVLYGGSPYWIVNITSHSKDKLLEKVKEFESEVLTIADVKK